MTGYEDSRRSLALAEASAAEIDSARTADAAHGDGRAVRRRRDPALDLLRVVALARVMVWHTFAAPWMTLFAAMPVMFFVGGALLGDPSEERSHAQVVLRRARRLLLPLWVYGGVVAVAGAVNAARAGRTLLLTPDSLWGATSWIVPIADPARSDWHGGWLSDHLWYLRAYFWIVALAPLFAALARRLHVALPVFTGGVAIMEISAHHSVPLLHAGAVRIFVGDLIVYGLFVTLGMAYGQRRPSINRGLLAAGAAAAAAAVWWSGVPGGNVNGSYRAIALTGLAWLLAAGLLERSIRAVAAPPRIAAVSRAVSRRAVTIYLWHPAAIVVSYVVVGRWIPVPDFTFLGHRPLSSIVVVVVTLALTALAVVLVGWVEDVGAGQRLSLGRLRSALSRAALAWPAIALAIAVTVPVIASPAARDSVPGNALAIPPPPSYREALTNADFANGPDWRPLVDLTLAEAQLPGDDLRQALHHWRAERPQITAMAVGVAVRGMVWTGETPGDTGPGALAHKRYPIASLTKFFTMALVLQQAEAGLIELDAPVPALPGIPPAVDGRAISPRQLLQHTSGLVDYSLATGFDPARMLTPVTAVQSALRTKPAAPPGTVAHYASTNYLYLGLLLEHVTGRTYESLLGDLTSAVGLTDTALDNRTTPGRVGFAAAGIRSTVADLTAWGEALFDPGRVVSSEHVAALTAIGDHNVGLGTWPLCPCSTDIDGSKRATAMGQYVADGGMYHSSDGMTLVVHVQPAGVLDESALASLGDALRGPLRGA